MSHSKYITLGIGVTLLTLLVSVCTVPPDSPESVRSSYERVSRVVHGTATPPRGYRLSQADDATASTSPLHSSMARNIVVVQQLMRVESETQSDSEHATAEQENVPSDNTMGQQSRSRPTDPSRFQWRGVCAGSRISYRVIVSASHCFAPLPGSDHLPPHLLRVVFPALSDDEEPIYVNVKDLRAPIPIASFDFPAQGSQDAILLFLEDDLPLKIRQHNFLLFDSTTSRTQLTSSSHRAILAGPGPSDINAPPDRRPDAAYRLLWAMMEIAPALPNWMTNTEQNIFPASMLERLQRFYGGYTLLTRPAGHGFPRLGDSGSPLMIEDERGIPRIIGITSFGAHIYEDGYRSLWKNRYYQALDNLEGLRSRLYSLQDQVRGNALMFQEELETLQRQVEEAQNAHDDAKVDHDRARNHPVPDAFATPNQDWVGFFGDLAHPNVRDFLHRNVGYQIAGHVFTDLPFVTVSVAVHQERKITGHIVKVQNGVGLFTFTVPSLNHDYSVSITAPRRIRETRQTCTVTDPDSIGTGKTFQTGHFSVWRCA